MSDLARTRMTALRRGALALLAGLFVLVVQAATAQAHDAGGHHAHHEQHGAHHEAHHAHEAVPAAAPADTADHDGHAHDGECHCLSASCAPVLVPAPPMQVSAVFVAIGHERAPGASAEPQAMAGPPARPPRA